MNHYLAAAGLAWLVAFVVNLTLNNNNKTKGSFFASGGMPSKHSALVVGLATMTALEDGIDSASFAISLVVAVIVMYDAMNVRRAVGEDRRAVLSLFDYFKLGKKMTSDDPLRKFKSLGHQPNEVIVGATIGLLTTILYAALVI